MKRKNVELIVLILLVPIFALFNKEIMPQKKEITELELVKVIGMDKVEDDENMIEQTVLRTGEDESANSKSEGTSKTKSESSGLVFSAKGYSFSDIIRSFQTYINRSLTGSHIKQFLIGEEFAKSNIASLIDFNARDSEVRLDTNVYITKGSSAKDFLYEVATSKYDIGKKMENMEKNDEKNISDPTSLVELLKILSEDCSAGLIPSIGIISDKENTEYSDEIETTQNIEGFQYASMQKDEGSKSIFTFTGYGVIKKKTLVGYLTIPESISANILTNKKGQTNINLLYNNNDIISFTILCSSTTYEFKLDGDTIKKIIITTNMDNNFEQISTADDVFTEEKIIYLEDRLSEIVKTELTKTIEKVKEYKCDFLNIRSHYLVKHPFKYSKNKEDFLENMLNAEFEIKVNSKIKRTYDLLNIQSGG